MAKVIPYDVSGVEQSSGGGSTQPRPNWYVGKIVIAEQREEKKDGSPANDIHVAFDLGADYVWVHTYIGLSDAADWKLAEFVRALGLKDKGSINLDKIKGTLMRVKINADSYEGEYVGRAGRLMKADKGDKVLPADAATDENGSAQEDEAGDEPEAEATDAYEPQREDPDDPEVGSYDEWSDEDIEAEVSDRGVTVGGGRGSKRDKHIKALRADDESSVEAEAEEEPEAEAADDYDDWPINELEDEVNDRQLEFPKKTRGSNAEERYKAKLIELLREDDAANPFESDE